MNVNELPDTVFVVSTGFLYSDGEPSPQILASDIFPTLAEAEAFIMEYGRGYLFTDETCPITYNISEYALPPF